MRYRTSLLSKGLPCDAGFCRLPGHAHLPGLRWELLLRAGVVFECSLNRHVAGELLLIWRDRLCRVPDQVRLLRPGRGALLMVDVIVRVVLLEKPIAGRLPC